MTGFNRIEEDLVDCNAAEMLGSLMRLWICSSSSRNCNRVCTCVCVCGCAFAAKLACVWSRRCSSSCRLGRR